MQDGGLPAAHVWHSPGEAEPVDRVKAGGVQATMLPPPGWGPPSQYESRGQVVQVTVVALAYEPGRQSGTQADNAPDPGWKVVKPASQGARLTVALFWMPPGQKKPTWEGEERRDHGLRCEGGR